MKYAILFLLGILNINASAQMFDSLAIKQVDSLIQVSRDLTVKKDFDQALEVNAVAEKIALEKLGKATAAYGNTCFNRGEINSYMRNYPEAEKWFIESLDIRGKVAGKEHPDYVTTLDELAFLYHNTGNLKKAELFYLQVLAIQEKVIGKERPEYAASLNSLANLYDDMQNYEKAEPLYLQSKNIREKTLGKSNPLYGGSLINLASLYFDMGSFEKAEPIFLQAKEIFEVQLKNRKHPFYLNCLNNMANLYKAMGSYEKAEACHLQALSIRREIYGNEHPALVYSLFNLANLYFNMGNYKKAELLLLQAIALQEKLFGKENDLYAKCLNSLGGVYYNLDNYIKAKTLLVEAMTIIEKFKGKENRDFASNLNNLGLLFVALDSFEKAEHVYLEAIALCEKVIATEHPEYPNSLYNLALLNVEKGSYKNAESYLLKSMAIREKVLGKDHPDYTQNLSKLADLYERQTRSLESEPLLAEAITRSQALVVNATSFLSEQELAKYVFRFQNDGNNLSAYLLAREANEIRYGMLPNLAYDHALFYKGYLLTAASRLNAPSLVSPESAEINNRLKGYRRRLAAEYANPIAERQGVDELEERANAAEKELARSVAGYADAIRQVKFQEVKAKLKKSESAIEFVHFQVNFPQKTDSTMYAALLILPEIEHPKFIPLFEEKSLDSLLNSKAERKADYVNSLYTLADRGAVAIEASRKSLYEILWKPLEKELANVKTIYFSPSGLLHRINLDAIPISETETLADKYNLIELNSTRQLVIPTQIKNVSNDAVLYGGIQYEQDSMFQNNEPLMASRSRGELSFSNVDTTLRGGSWNYLAGTEREVSAIDKIMQTNGVQTKLKKGYAATEESFKNIGTNNLPSPRILHIATHGYFFSDPEEKVGSSQLALSSQESVYKMSDHPMLRSGLIMAGGNAAWQGKQALEGREDGILTAYEISQMNLSNTELVVLSACETGLGDIQGNEGVYGLQRAFKIAGAKYLIMSLWQVPDKQTSLLMTTFYKKWLENKMTIPDAFHAAQKELRDIGLDPYQWAGFVLVE